MTNICKTTVQFAILKMSSIIKLHSTPYYTHFMSLITNSSYSLKKDVKQNTFKVECLQLIVASYRYYHSGL